MSWEKNASLHRPSAGDNSSFAATSTCSAWGRNRPANSLFVLVSGQVAAGFKIGEQVENLLFREGVQQADRHHGRTLRFSFLDLRFLECLDERVGGAGLDGGRVGVFLDNHTGQFVAVLQ